MRACCRAAIVHVGVVTSDAIKHAVFTVVLATVAATVSAFIDDISIILVAAVVVVQLVDYPSFSDA